MSIFRDSFAGTLIRLLSSNQLLRYPEEEPNLLLPTDYLQTKTTVSPIENENDGQTPTSDPETGAAVRSESNNATSKGAVLVTWYSDSDPENPQNWSSAKKVWVAGLLFAYTFAAYIGSSVYTASIPGIRQEFQTSEAVASLGMTLYVFAYGLGPLLFSPLAEIPAIGRNPPYVITFCVFTVLTVAVPLAKSMAGILVVRFLLGFFCSPALATVGASYGDMFHAARMQFVIALWGGGATLAPSLGPLLTGYAVEAKGWRWSAWELLWLSAAVALLMIFTLPETSSDAILLSRARRLRRITGNENLVSASELGQKNTTPGAIAFGAMIKPWQINALDPAVLFTTMYTALTYGIYYSFFESFPAVFTDVYGFGLGSTGLAFLSILVGLVVAMVLLCCYLAFVAPARFAKMATVQPEARMWPALFGSFLMPIGLFIFAWTAREDIHWIACMVGVAISMCGNFIIIQAMFVYLPFTYPRYVGSLFAANGLARSLFAGAAILFSPPMFNAIGVSGGVSLLAGLSVLCIFGLYFIYYWGASLRKRSKFAES